MELASYEHPLMTHLFLSFGVMGALEDCIARAREYALERKQFKVPIGVSTSLSLASGVELIIYEQSFQLVQKKLADAHTEATLGLLAAVHLARLKDKGELNRMLSLFFIIAIRLNRFPATMISLLKRNNCGKALQYSRVLLDILGGNGVVEEYGIARHVANLQVANTYE